MVHTFKVPHVAAGVAEIEQKFNLQGDSYPGHDDVTVSIEYATDFWTLSRAKHDEVLDWVRANNGANAARLGITYIVTWGRIWSLARRSEGVRRHSDADSSDPSRKHTNHIHVSWNAKAPAAFRPAPPKEELSMTDVQDLKKGLDKVYTELRVIRSDTDGTEGGIGLTRKELKALDGKVNALGDRLAALEAGQKATLTALGKLAAPVVQPPAGAAK